jgi:hypothetical protein
MDTKKVNAAFFKETVAAPATNPTNASGDRSLFIKKTAAKKGRLKGASVDNIKALPNKKPTISNR